MHRESRTFRSTPVGIGLAIFATITLILSFAAVVRPNAVLATEHEGGQGTAECPAGTVFLDNIEVDGEGNINGSFAGLTFELVDDGKALEVTNTTDDQTFTIVVKGGSDQNGGGDGEPVEVGPGETVTVTAPINPNNDQPFGVSNFSICGTENGGEDGEDLTLIKQDLEAGTLAGVGFTLGDGDEILTGETGQIVFENLVEGSFTLTETSNPDEDCETGGTLTVTVSAEGVISVTDDDDTDTLAIVSFNADTNVLVLSNDCEGEGGEDNGILEIDKFYCAADEDGTEFIVSDPAPLENLRVQGVEEQPAGCEQGDATFTIEKSTGEIWEGVMLGADGQIELPLPDGEYTITETSTDEEPAPSASFTIENGAITAVIVINSIGEEEDQGQLKIIKLFCEADEDSVTFTIEGGEQQPPSLENCELGDATFRLNDGDTFTIGADGILFANVEVGDYTLTEVAPNQATSPSFAIVEGEITTVIVVNNGDIDEGEQPGGGEGPGQNETPREGTRGSSGGPSGGLPNTAVSPIPTGSVPAALLALLMLTGLGAAGYAVRAEAQRRR